jgi:glyoxylase-like metal-dependent hydrolase (beta-lactamase superfamily II)
MTGRRGFSAGALECVSVSDGELPLPAAMLFANADREVLGRALGEELDERGMTVGRFNPLVVRSPEAVALVDTGFGRFAPAPGAGQLLDSLRAEGIEPDQIDVVVITHAHPDHLGGLVDAGEPVFARARHVILAAEWEFWTSASADAPESITGSVEQALRPLHQLGLLELAEHGREVAPGVRMIHAPGHTPGHAAVELGDPPAAVFLADAVLHEVGFQHTEWTSAIDHEPQLAVETRRALLARAVEQQLLVAAYHLGRHGFVRRDGDSFHLVDQRTCTDA